MKFWSHLQEQKKNNKGSSLVTVLGVMALVMILVTVIMSISAMNFQMKYTNMNAKKNFYTAEAALEEIRTALVQQVSEASSLAYVAVMEKYTDMDAADRTDYFEQKFAEYFKGAEWYDNTIPTAPVYKADKLEAFLRETKENAKVTAPAGRNVINLDSAGIILKNVTVTYTDTRDYETQIQTDIVLRYPKVDFAQISNMPNLLSYALVANDSFFVNNITGQSKITGNVYLGKNGAEIGNASVELLNPTEEFSGSMAATNGVLKIKENGALSCKGIELWARDLVVDSSRAEVAKGANNAPSVVYLQDDLILSNSRKTSSKVSIAGEYYGYGNIDTAAAANSIAGNEALTNQIANHPAEYSSSMIINGTGSTLNLTGLTQMMIAGNTYVNGTEQSANASLGGNKEDVLMGESISLKADQLAYLVPGECVAPGMVSGGANPMTKDQYQRLLKELKENYGKDNAAYDPQKDLVNYTIPAEDFGNTSLQALGVNSFQMEAYAVNAESLDCMIYLFMKFDSVSSANQFFQTYYSDNKNLTTLGKMLDLYTTAGVQLPADILDETKKSEFYFNGNVLADGNTSVYVPERFSSLSGDTQAARRLSETQMNCQDSFQALGMKLVKDYAQLTSEEKQKDVYGNLVNSFTVHSEPDYIIADGTKKTFVSQDGEAAVVVNGDYHLDADALLEIKNAPDAEGAHHSEAKLHVVIASGDVTIEEDFAGMILAGGKISIQNREVQIQADAKAAGCALRAKNNKGFCAADYLVNGDSYVLSGSGADGEAAKTQGISMNDCVIYENWKKQ